MLVRRGTFTTRSNVPLCLTVKFIWEWSENTSFSNKSFRCCSLLFYENSVWVWQISVATIYTSPCFHRFVRTLECPTSLKRIKAFPDQRSSWGRLQSWYEADPAKLLWLKYAYLVLKLWFEKREYAGRTILRITNDDVWRLACSLLLNGGAYDHQGHGEEKSALPFPHDEQWLFFFIFHPHRYHSTT